MEFKNSLLLIQIQNALYKFTLANILDFCHRNKIYHIENKVNKLCKFSHVKTKLSYQEYVLEIVIYSLVPLTGGATARVHILRLPTDYATYISGEYRHISHAKLASWYGTDYVGSFHNV